jgi:hypothetical protein
MEAWVGSEVGVGSRLTFSFHNFRYNDQDKDELAEESGWKLVHADVFRPPPNAILLCASLGTGMQLLAMSAVSILCAMLGFLSPANRGGLLTATILAFMLMGVPAGYMAAYTYKSMRGTEWKRATILTATLYPGLVCSTLFILNFFIWGQQSSGAVPFGTMVALLLMWFGISVPLVFAGAFFGFKAKLKDPPTRTNEIPRQVPEQAWYMLGAFNVLMGGILPFGAIFIEVSGEIPCAYCAYMQRSSVLMPRTSPARPGFLPVGAIFIEVSAEASVLMPYQCRRVPCLCRVNAGALVPMPRTSPALSYTLRDPASRCNLHRAEPRAPMGLL